MEWNGNKFKALMIKRVTTSLLALISVLHCTYYYTSIFNCKESLHAKIKYYTKKRH